MARCLRYLVSSLIAAIVQLCNVSKGIKACKLHLNHGEVLAVLGVELVIAALDDGELADVVVDRLLAGRCTLQQSENKSFSILYIQISLISVSSCHLGFYGLLTLSRGV